MSPAHKLSLRCLATWFGLGLSPVVPGTMGTLGALPLAWLFVQQGEMAYLGLTVGFSVFAILVAHFYEMEITPGQHDTPEFVMDEVAGFLVTMAMLPFTLPMVILGFVLFRALDMIKPFPISWVDRKVLGGVGAVADDLLAGIIASAILQYLYQNGYLASYLLLFATGS